MIRYKEDSITLLVVIITSLFFVFTPGRETLGSAVQGFIMALIFFGLLPLGYHLLVLKKTGDTFGLAAGAWRSRPLLIAPVVVTALLITIICFRVSPGFQTAFLLPGIIENSFGWFIGYELFLVPMLVAVYEIFFRGFIQKSWLEKHVGAWAIFGQSLIFVAFLAMTASFGWTTFPFILFSLFSGFLVWYNNSLVQAWIAQWLYLLLFDVFLLIMH